jgi:hypothetical protein
MAAQPELYNLVWRAFSFVSRHDPSKGEFQAATHHVNTIDTRPNIPAIILYPALLTPNIHVRGENDGMIEILVAAPKSPDLKPEHVNFSLKFAPGLEAKKHVSEQDLFDDPTDKIVVKPVTPDGFGQLSTENLFRGILHDTVSNWLPKELDGFYAIQVHESCLAAAAQAASGDGGDTADDTDSDDDADADSGSSAEIGTNATAGSDAGAGADGGATTNTEAPSDPDDPGELEYQDFVLDEVLHRLNGPALRQTRDQGGFGTHEFEFDVDGADYSQVDLQRPIVAYHPLYLYPEESLQTVNLGHVSDIHINARQKLLAKSPARVIDAESGIAESPVIGSMMNTFERSFVSILDAIDDKGVDVLLVGGDLIEHVDNAFPYHDGTTAEKLRFPSAAAVWDLVDVDNNYDRNYQSYVDYIAFFTAIRHFCSSKKKPAFVVTGNHDCYKNNHIYGISPRLLLGFKKANEGIPADHNLTFYEAMLVFGESWDSVAFGELFDPKYYEWFYAVLTPFSDFNLQLPKILLAGLGWGKSEESVSLPGSLGQGGLLGHLPRASEAVTEAQVALAKPDASAGKKTVLMSHFTFVSYVESVAFGDGSPTGHLDVGGTGLFRSGDPFGKFDFGTFEKRRSDLYKQMADGNVTSCGFSGHSHRKSMYLLGTADDEGYPTEAYGLRNPTGIVNPATRIDGRPPIIVSDSAGPLPRINFDGFYGAGAMFGEYGSDRPSGTMVSISDTGAVTSIEPVYSTLDQTKPRLAVAVDYQHVMNDHVFKEISVEPFDRAQATTCQHSITIVFEKHFAASLAEGIDVVLFARASPAYDWNRIPLEQTQFVLHDTNHDNLTTATFRVPVDRNQDFFNWLTLGSKAGRFMSFGFANANGLDDIYDVNSRWNIEAEAKPSFWNFWGSQKYDIIPHGENTGLLHTHNEAPNFSWRRQFAPYR